MGSDGQTLIHAAVCVCGGNGCGAVENIAPESKKRKTVVCGIRREESSVAETRGDRTRDPHVVPHGFRIGSHPRK